MRTYQMKSTLMYNKQNIVALTKDRLRLWLREKSDWIKAANFTGEGGGNCSLFIRNNFEQTTSRFYNKTARS